MITQVVYARLYKLPDFENERFEAVAIIENGDVAAAWSEARACVETQYQQWLAERRNPPAPGPVPASDKQRNYIAMLQIDLGWHGEQLAVYADEQKVDLVAMTVDQASRLINGMKRLLNNQSTQDIPF